MRTAPLLVITLIAVVVSGNTCAREPLARLSDARSEGERTTTPLGEGRAAIYEGGLKGKWRDYGWAPRALDDGKPARLDVGRFGGWILKHDSAGPASGEALLFRFRAPKETGDFLEVRLEHPVEQALPRVAVDARHRRSLAEGWEEVLVPMTELNPQKLKWDRVVLRAHKKLPSTWVELDGIVVVLGAGGALPADDDAAGAKLAIAGPVKDVSFTIDCNDEGAPIDRRIYGIAFSPRTMNDDGHVFALGATARRWGGNPADRFNWKLGNAWNAANDWFFMNLNYTDDPKWTWRAFLEENKRRGMQTALTLPLIGWVAKDQSSYSFPTSHFGKQEQTSPDNDDVGNGKEPDGDLIAPGPPTRTSVEAGPELVAEWVKEIKALDEQSGGKLVHTYLLGNEPMLWNTTHRDVHPEPVSYDELLERTVRYATAVKKVDPTARLAGPALWGWPAYFHSAVDAEAGFFLRPDRRKHGDVPLLEWYLAELAKHEQKTGIKLLDAVDLHFYPQSDVHNDRTDRDTAARRIRSTRALWDPRYDDESWINEPIRLIPRVEEIIARTSPGLDLIVGEWSFGAEEHMSGALALAEALGRFGQLGVDEAYYWTYPKAGSPAFWAFRAYRDYDSDGGRFLDVGIAGTAPEGASLFASRDAQREKIVAVALNFSPDEALDAKVALAGCREPKAVRVMSLSAERLGLAPGQSAFKGPLVRAILPAYSVNVVEVTFAPPSEVASP